MARLPFGTASLCGHDMLRRYICCHSLLPQLCTTGVTQTGLPPTLCCCSAAFPPLQPLQHALRAAWICVAATDTIQTCLHTCSLCWSCLWHYVLIVLCLPARVLHISASGQSLNKPKTCACPAGMLLVTEWWASEIVVMTGGLLPGDAQRQLSAMSIYQAVNSLCFMLPLGFGVAVTTRSAPGMTLE